MSDLTNADFSRNYFAGCDTAPAPLPRLRYTRPPADALTLAETVFNISTQATVPVSVDATGGPPPSRVSPVATLSAVAA